MDVIQFLVKSTPQILREVASARVEHEMAVQEGYRTGFRDGSNFTRNNLFTSPATRDRTLALLIHSDEVDTAKNQLGSHSGRNVLVASLVIANASSVRLTSPKNVYTFLLTSKEVYQKYTRADIFSSLVREIAQLREGINVQMFAN